MKYGFIRDHKSTYRITLLCRVLEVSARGYYDWLCRSESNRESENKLLLKEIKQIFETNREVYGAPGFMQSC